MVSNGPVIPYRLWVARLRETGSIHFPLEELPAELTVFRRELRRAAKAEGIRVLTSATNGIFLAWDPDYVVTDEQLRAAMDAAALQLPATDPDCPQCGTRCVPRGAAWVCRNCGLPVLS